MQTQTFNMQPRVAAPQRQLPAPQSFRNCAPAARPARVSAAPACRDGVRGAAAVCRAAAVEYGAVSDVGAESNNYLVLGLAHCFEKNDEGKLVDRMVIEPIAANSLECMVLGAKTCFKAVVGLVLGQALAKDKAGLPAEFADAVWCANYEFRCGATARTWLRPHAQDNLLDLVPLGQTRTKFNFSLDDKRVLNFENVVSDADNIKQDMSIDVYGRKEAEEAPASAPAAAPAAKKQEEEDDDDLDSLLSA